MSVWIGLVVLAQILNAAVAIVDKYIVTSRKVARPYLYAFYVSVLSTLAVVVFAFSWVPIPIAGVSVPSFVNIGIPTVPIALLELVSGFAFFGAAYLLYLAFADADASDVIPVVGSMSAVASLVMSFFLFDVGLSPDFFTGFVLLVVGTLLVSRFRLSRRVTALALLSGLFFAAHFVILKILFATEGFDNAFFWTRIAIAVAALSTLILPVNRDKLLLRTKEAGRAGAAWWILGNKALAGFAALLILKATELGDVSLVQALGGLQFVFLISFTVAFGNITSPACGENVNTRALLHKIVAVAIITVGFFLLFV